MLKQICHHHFSQPKRYYHELGKCSIWGKGYTSFLRVERRFMMESMMGGPNDGFGSGLKQYH